MGLFGARRSHRADAVITGAGSGIGAAFAAELACRGGRVLCSDIDLDAARATADALSAAGGTALAAPATSPTSTTCTGWRTRRDPGSAAHPRW